MLPTYRLRGVLFQIYRIGKTALNLSICEKCKNRGCFVWLKTSSANVRFYGVMSPTSPNDWNKAVSDAEKIVGYPTSFMSLRCLLSDELSNVAMHMRKLMGTRHPLLKTAKGLVYDGRHCQQTRGLIVLLVSKAAGPGSRNQGEFVDQDIISGIYPSQRSLAEITEMIYTANLIHKGVVNLTDIDPAVDGPIKDMEFGNKMAVLSGDFLLANASTGLAELSNTKVVEIISSAIGDLMEAEFTGFRDKHGSPVIPSSVTFSDWLKQTYLSSGSLLAKGCQAALELASHSEDIQNKAFEFGVNMAYAQQLSEDLQPFLKPDEHLDQLSLTSAPVLRYVESHGYPLLDSLKINQYSSNKRKIVSLIHSGLIIEECKAVCHDFGKKAIQALGDFHASDAKIALSNIVQAVSKSLT